MVEDETDPEADDYERDAARRAALSPLLGSEAFRPRSAAVRVEIGAQSHRGASRQSNDDHYVVIRLGRHQETLATSLSAAELPPRFEEHAYAMLVADGLGEGGSGSVASRVAISTVAHMALQYGQWNMRIDPRTAAEIVKRAEEFYAGADAAVSAKRQTSSVLANMTTTLTAAYSAGDDLFFAHVGHSRAYLFRGGDLTLLTRDHTIEQHMAEMHGPAPVEKRARDLRHILTDALGAAEGHELFDVERFRLSNGDCILLCTNGLTDMVSDDQIADVLALRRTPREQCDILVDRAIEQGGEDNVTVVLAQYEIPGG